jgi:hypothetical protein
MFIFGGWLLTVWITIQVRNTVYLEYPYLRAGVGFFTLGVIALLCIAYATRWRRAWSALFVFPVLAGLWTMVAVPDIIPYDLKSSAHIHNLVNELELFRKQTGRFPDRESALSAAVLQEPSSYYQKGRQLPFRTVVVPNATGPFLDNPGAEPGVIFCAVSTDQQEAWLTGTEIRFPHRPGSPLVQFIPFLSADSDMRVLHLHAALVSK